MATAFAKIDPRTFRHSLELQRRVNPIEDFDDESCPTSEDWMIELRLKGHVKPLRAMEIINAQRIMERVTHIVTCRWNDRITSAKRFIFCQRVLNISGVINVDERNKFAECLCIEDPTAPPQTGV